MEKFDLEEQFNMEEHFYMAVLYNMFEHFNTEEQLAYRSSWRSGEGDIESS